MLAVEGTGRIPAPSSPGGQVRPARATRPNGHAQDPLAGQTLEVTDDSIRGEQTIAFAPEQADVRVTLASPTGSASVAGDALIDLLFIRRAMADSLV